MTGPLPYYHVDAFAARPLTGNPAAVMPLDSWLPDETMQAIAAENNFAETAFLVPDASGESDYELRWFTPALEVALCGHATLASGWLLLEQDQACEAIQFRTRKAGILEVRRGGDGICKVGLPAIATSPDTFPEAVAGLGAEPVEISRSDKGYSIMRYETEAQVRALKPDMQALAALGDEQFIATAPGADSDIVSRVFVPGAGVPEDNATGSAHAALTPYWAARLARDSFAAVQASAKGGWFDCRLDGDRVWLGGRCFLVVEGRFYL